MDSFYHGALIAALSAAGALRREAQRTEKNEK
jgi:hypothetical protein